MTKSRERALDSKPAFSNADATRVSLQATVCNINFFSLEGMKKKDTEKELSAHPDFSAELSVVEKRHGTLDTAANFFPNFSASATPSNNCGQKPSGLLGRDETTPSRTE